MEIFLLLLQIPLLIFIIKYIRKLNSDPLLVNAYYYLLSIKVTAGLILGVLYFSYYKYGDTVSFCGYLDFLDELFYSNPKDYARLIFFGEISHGLENVPLDFRDMRVFIFIRIISPFYILSSSNYWILSVYLSLFSFFGLWILSNTLIKLYNLKPLVIVISFFTFPSVVFWSSGVIKESLTIGIMCIIISLILNLATRQGHFSILKFVVLLCFSYVLLYMKFYYFVVLFAVILPYGFVKYFYNTVEVLRINKSYRISLFISLLLVMAIVASFAHPLININIIFETLYLNYQTTLGLTDFNTYTFEGLSSNPASFISHIPKALSYGIFGPFLWQCKNLITLLNGLENTLLLILFITFLLTNFRKEKLMKIDIEVISLVVYVSTLAIFMAFASPNWGSLVRYKIGYLPFFLLLILNNNPIIFQLERVFSFLNRSEKKS
jgi:hypothetical protein